MYHFYDSSWFTADQSNSEDLKDALGKGKYLADPKKEEKKDSD